MTPFEDIAADLMREINRLHEDLRHVHPLMLAAPQFFDAEARAEHGPFYRESAERLHAAFQRANAVVVSTSQRLELLLDDGLAGGRVQ
jgi:hypothetical protein